MIGKVIKILSYGANICTKFLKISEFILFAIEKRRFIHNLCYNKTNYVHKANIY